MINTCYNPDEGRAIRPPLRPRISSLAPPPHSSTVTAEPTEFPFQSLVRIGGVEETDCRTHQQVDLATASPRLR
jgi:hypothetical protein